MLGRLMKYEFKATARVYLPLFGALLVTAAVSSLMAEWGKDVPTVIAYTLSVFIMIAVAVVTFVITIQRFSKNLIGDEGYLMFTLPVSTDSIIFGKLLTAAIWQIISSVVVFLSIWIMALRAFDIADFQMLIHALERLFTQMGVSGVLVILEAAVAAVVAVCSSVLMLYCCISLGMLVNRRRGLLSFGAFIGIVILSEILGSIAITTGMLDWIGPLFDGLSIGGRIHAGIWGLTAWQAVSGAIFYFVTRYMLKNRLNLE